MKTKSQTIKRFSFYEAKNKSLRTTDNIEFSPEVPNVPIVFCSYFKMKSKFLVTFPSMSSLKPSHLITEMGCSSVIYLTPVHTFMTKIDWDWDQWRCDRVSSLPESLWAFLNSNTQYVTLQVVWGCLSSSWQPGPCNIYISISQAFAGTI